MEEVQSFVSSLTAGGESGQAEIRRDLEERWDDPSEVLYDSIMEGGP